MFLSWILEYCHVNLIARIIYFYGFCTYFRDFRVKTDIVNITQPLVIIMASLYKSYQIHTLRFFLLASISTSKSKQLLFLLFLLWSPENKNRNHNSILYRELNWHIYSKIQLKNSDTYSCSIFLQRSILNFRMFLYTSMYI